MTSRPPKRSTPSGDGTGQRTGWARVPGITRLRSDRMRLTVTVICLCALAAGVSVAVFSSPGHAHHVAGSGNNPSPAGTQTAPPTGPATSSHNITSTNVTSDRIAETALRWPPRLKHQISRWAKGPGGAALSGVTAQLGYAMQAAGLKLYPAMTRACVNLAADVSTARAAPPIPDAAMQHLYAKTLTGIDRATAECRHAISTHQTADEITKTRVNQALLSRSRREFAAMSAKLYRATAEIRSLRH